MKAESLSRVLPLCIGIATLLAVAGESRGQTASPAISAVVTDEFEVASIRPATISGKGVFRVGFTVDAEHGIFRCSYCSVQSMILYSQNLHKYQVSGPDWIAEDTYAVEARMPVGSSSEAVRRMILKLLVDRFGMQFHLEQRRLAAYVLTVGPGGAKLPRVAKPGTRVSTPLPGALSLSGATMDDLVARLGARRDRPVLNRTGLDGFFDIEVKWDPVEVDDGGLDPRLVRALRDELGLILKAESAAIQAFVVDRAGRVPIPN